MKRGLQILFNPFEWDNPKCDNFFNKRIKLSNNKIKIIEFNKQDRSDEKDANKNGPKVIKLKNTEISNIE